QGHGRGTEGAEGTQELADAVPRWLSNHGRSTESAERIQDIEYPISHQYEGHGRGGKGTPGSTPWAPDCSLIPRLRECRSRDLTRRPAVAYPSSGEVAEGEAMTEAEWLACTDPTPMLELMEKRISARKPRLFAVACCRNLWNQTSSKGQRAVEVAERFADAAANERALARAGTAAGLLVSGVMMAGHQWAAFACHARALYA